MVKHIVTSEAYQCDATATAAALSADPDNRLLARGPRLRSTPKCCAIRRHRLCCVMQAPLSPPRIENEVSVDFKERPSFALKKALGSGNPPSQVGQPPRFVEVIKRL